MNDTISATFGDPIGAILFLVLAALAIAIPLALFLLRRYRKAVDRLMQTHSDETPQGARFSPFRAAGSARLYGRWRRPRCSSHRAVILDGRILVSAPPHLLRVADKFQEHWIQYRTTCESLRHEKYLYLTTTEPYDVEEPFPLLVQRVEALISKENTSWGQYLRKAREEGARPEHPARND